MQRSRTLRLWRIVLLAMTLAALAAGQLALDPVTAQTTPRPVIPAGEEWVFNWLADYSSHETLYSDGGVSGVMTLNSRTRGSARIRSRGDGYVDVSNYLNHATDEYRFHMSDSSPENCFIIDDYETVVEPGFLNGREFTMSMDPPAQQADGSWRFRLNDTLFRTNQSAYAPSIENSTYIGCRGGNYNEFRYRTEDPDVLWKLDDFVPYLESTNQNEFVTRASITKVGQPDQWGNVEVENLTGFITARRVSCPAGNGPFQANDPELRDMRVGVIEALPPSYVQPDPAADKVAYFAVLATCNGKPVQNAELKVYLDVVAGSGGHPELDGRPRGYLNGMKITSDEQFITVRTNDRGMAGFRVEPGRDTRNQRIWIAGEHTVTVESTRFPDARDEATARFKYHNLVQLPDDDGNRYRKLRADTFGYYDAYYATPATISRLIEPTSLGSLANLYQTDQVIQNGLRELDGKPAWPILPLMINDLSLPWGGLFPTIGWDEQRGRVIGKPWQPPHYTHLDGTVVDLSLPRSLFAGWPDAAEAYATHRAVLRNLAALHGRALSSTTLTYRINQTPLTAAAAANVQTQTAAPDLFVDAFTNAEVPAAAPGQPFTTTLSVGNLAGSASASGVSLTATLPADLEFVAAEPAPSSVNGRQLSWQLGELAPDRLALVQLTLRFAPNTAPASEVTLVAAAATTANEANPADNRTELALWSQAPGPDLVVTTNLPRIQLSSTAPATVTFEVANLGNQAAPASSLTLSSPSSMLIFPQPGSAAFNEVYTQTWDLATLAPGERRTITAQLAPLSGGTTPVSFTLEAATSATDLDLDNNQLTVQGRGGAPAYDLAVSLDVDGAANGQIRTGEALTLTLRYTNQGELPAPTSAVTLSLGSGLRLLGATPNPTNVTDAITATWQLGDLAPNASGTISLRVQADQLDALGTPVSALIREATLSLDRHGGNNRATVLLRERPAAPPFDEFEPPPAPPDTTITSGPSGIVTVTEASFSFTGNGGTGDLRFECSLDDASFAPCTSPANYTNLSLGTHRFRVRAVDANNQADPTPAEATWTIQAQPAERFMVYLPQVRR
ncbi:MAG: CARDB domain-containing protein [Oscillochloridaceae bacterium umkhey_bin13]